MPERESLDTPLELPEPPEGWLLTRMGEVANVVGGGTPSSSVQENFADDGYPWITPADLSGFNGIYIERGRRALSKKGLQSCSATLMPKGTVLMSSRAPIGYVAVAASPIATNQGFKSFICHRDIVPEYIYFWLKFIKPHLEHMGSGSTFLEISGSRAREIPLLLAPTAEQERIAAKVKTLLARVNATRERLTRVPRVLKRFRQAILAAACSGRLTEDWRVAYPDVEPAQALLERIGEEKRKLWLEEVLRKGHNPNTSKPPAATTPNPAFDIDAPERWAVASMDELTSRITSGSRDWKRYYCDNGPGTFIMAQNVRPLCFDRSYRLGVAPPENDRDRERSQVKQGDILVTIVGANTGDVGRISEPVAQHYVCQSVALMRPVFEEISPFLELFLNSPQHGQVQYQDWIYGEGRPHLSFDHLRATAVLLPPLLEQHEIARRVEVLFKLADAIEKRVAAATTRAEKLSPAILAKAFRGELAPTEAELARREGRSCEPASELLARIKAERAPQKLFSGWENAKGKTNSRSSRPSGR